MGKLALVLGGIAGIAFLIFIGPFLSIWALNTLFTLAIPYTFETWAAAGILNAVVSGGLIQSKK